MSDFTNSDQKSGFSVKLWRGERMCLIGMDVENPEPDLVGFSIEVCSPGQTQFNPLRNRLNFSYDKPASTAVDGFRNYPSTQAPFQKFRWIHFPYDPKGGKYIYRVTKQHMPTDGNLKAGTSILLDIPLDIEVYHDFLDVGFTRNFASSQAFADKYMKIANKIIPAKADQGLKFQKVPGDVYQWLGFEAYQLINDFLDEVEKDETVSLDFFAYDFNEPDILDRLCKIGKRVRAIIDNSGSHAPATSAESQAAEKLSQPAVGANVKRMHFDNLQHNKVLIAKRNDKAYKVLFGSTNFSFRGLFIQANNALVFSAQEAAGIFEQTFELAFTDPKKFATDPISTKWHLVQLPDKPPVHLCFSPHSDPDLSLNPLAAAIDQATSSVFFSIAFLYQSSGPTRDAINRLMNKTVFSYGISDRKGSLHIRKPDGSIGIVDFEYLAKNAPEPFKSEWSGGAGIHQHDKFVVTDFSLPTAKVFTGSSNLSPSGEEGNGDNLVMIEDPRVATSYAIEALRIFDHLHFRSRMQDATKASGKKPAQSSGKKKDTLTLQKPTAISGEPAWFEPYYEKASQKEKDRELFSH